MTFFSVFRGLRGKIVKEKREKDGNRKEKNILLKVCTSERLQNIMVDLDKFCKESGLDVNWNNAKIIVFRQGGKRKGEKWWYKGEEIELVNK